MTSSTKDTEYNKILKKGIENYFNRYSDVKIYKQLKIICQLNPHSDEEVRNYLKLRLRDLKKMLPNKCEHGSRKNRCKICDYPGYCYDSIMREIRLSLLNHKELPDKEYMQYLGCDINTFKHHIEEKFTGDMCWNNRGSDEGWQFDHIIPVKYNNPSDEERLKRLHYKNIQPLSKAKNQSKGNRYISEVNVGKGKVIIDGNKINIDGDNIKIKLK